MTEIKFQCRQHGYQKVKEINFGILVSTDNTTPTANENAEYSMGLILECGCKYVQESHKMIWC